MVKKLKMTFSLCLVLICLTSCGMSGTLKNNTSLNDWQKNLLQAEGLPTEYEELTATQQNAISRIYEMITYLNEKYSEEFIYVQYIHPEEFESEKLIAYPRSTGSGNGKYLVTVKDGFTDNYFDYSVADYSESLINDFLAERFETDEYRLFTSPNACQIKKSEIVDGNFQWKYGATNGIFLLEEACDMDEVEEFAVQYAKWLYEHQLSGAHRIEIMHTFPEWEDDWNLDEIYVNKEGNCAGFYCFSFNSSKKALHTDGMNYDAGNIHMSKEYTVEEFFSKYE